MADKGTETDIGGSVAIDIEESFLELESVDDYDEFENDIMYEDDSIAVYNDMKSQLDADTSEGEEEEEIKTEEPAEIKTEPVKKTNITTKFLTKYERTRILGVRATQIAHGAPILINKNLENGRVLNDPKEIAELELLNRKLPYILRRRLPSKVMHKPNYEYVHLNQLIIF